MQVGVAPNTITYNAALAALEKGGRWEQTIGLLQQVRLIATDCARLRLSSATGMLEHMHASGVSPDD